MKLLIITGMSGAGKSHAMSFLEDMGYFCVDNMPPALLPKFAELYIKSESTMEKIALVMDVRGGEMLNDVIPTLEKLELIDVQYEIIFFDCADNVLINRFKENRRLHPLTPGGNLVEGIQLERKYLEKIRQRSNYVFDTTNLTTWELKKEMTDIFVMDRKASGLKISVISFGFKYGVPGICDLVFDVRFIPNPYYDKDLKHFTGNDDPVKNYVLDSCETITFLAKLKDMLKFLLPCYTKEGKELLVIGIGCTGGRHRSVAIANESCKMISELGYTVSLEHHDIGK